MPMMREFVCSSGFAAACFVYVNILLNKYWRVSEYSHHDFIILGCDMVQRNDEEVWRAGVYLYAYSDHIDCNNTCAFIGLTILITLL